MADSIWLNCLTQTKARLDSMTFTSMGNDNWGYPQPSSTIIQQDFDPNYGYQYPSFVIIPGFDYQIQEDIGPNEKDDYYYPVMVQIIDKKSFNYSQGSASHLKWREQIVRAFHHSKLTGVPEVYIGLARGVSRVNKDMWEAHRDFVGGVELTFKTRLTRGLNT